jgi:hypothetical protein
MSALCRAAFYPDSTLASRPRLPREVTAACCDRPAELRSRASVGNITFLGCTVVSTMTSDSGTASAGCTHSNGLDLGTRWHPVYDYRAYVLAKTRTRGSMT